MAFPFHQKHVKTIGLIYCSHKNVEHRRNGAILQESNRPAVDCFVAFTVAYYKIILFMVEIQSLATAQSHDEKIHPIHRQDHLPMAYLAKSGPFVYYYRSNNPKQ